MRGNPQTAGEWADTLEDEAIAEVAAKEGTVEDIRETHVRMITELFESRAEANMHTPAIVQNFMKDMREALQRVDVLAEARTKAVEKDQEIDEAMPGEDVLVETIDERKLAQGKFQNAPIQLAA